MILKNFIKNLKIETIIVIIQGFLWRWCLWQRIQMLLCNFSVRMLPAQIIAKYSQRPREEGARLRRLALGSRRIAKRIQDYCHIEMILPG